MFIDEVRIYARAGHGGRGCVAFQREASRPKGGPSGGNGGRGGDVILEADHDLNNLIAQYYAPRLIAEKGQNGMGKGMDGRAGKNLIVKVPCGTMVWRLSPGDFAPSASDAEVAETTHATAPLKLSCSSGPILRCARSERALEFNLAEATPPPSLTHSKSSPQGELIADLTEPGQQFVLCQGGRGGQGNRNFATSRRQAPRFAQPGEPGDEGHFLFELRLMADVGLVGFPNAGKSTLLAAISRARPRIAPYPFTTLHPQVGIVEYADLSRLMVCDVPGLIEGAHLNHGLGHAFLRHIQRCKVLVFLLDMAGTDGRLPWHDFEQLVEELQLYSPTLLEKTRLLVANKMDEPAAEANLKKFKRKISQSKILPISAAFDQGLDPFKQAIRQAVNNNITGRGNSKGTVACPL
jgi:GTP-binding protein